MRQITNNLDSARSQTFTYDQLNRLATAETPTAWGLSFTHDPWGNLLQQTVTKGSAPMLNVSVNNQNQITNPGFSYDAAGNLANDGSLPYTYDAENLLTSADGFTYTYDGDGKRVEKSTGVLYWYGLCSAGNQVLLETDSAGNPLPQYIFFSRRRIARRDSNGSVYYFFDDHLASVRVVTNSTGGVVEDSDYYPFGAERVFVDGLDNPYKFVGHERDSESGLDYYRYRMLSSSLGRWTASDPIFDRTLPAQSFNGYSYVANIPTVLTDHLGQFVIQFSFSVSGPAGRACIGLLLDTEDAGNTGISTSCDSGDGGPGGAGNECTCKPRILAFRQTVNCDGKTKHLAKSLGLGDFSSLKDVFCIGIGGVSVVGGSCKQVGQGAQVRYTARGARGSRAGEIIWQYVFVCPDGSQCTRERPQPVDCLKIAIGFSSSCLR